MPPTIAASTERAGLISRVVPAAELIAEALALAEAVAGMSSGIEGMRHVDVVGGIDADAGLLVLRSSSTWRTCR
jgi:enoyl-CoA hydratase/carnithine racemase